MWAEPDGVSLPFALTDAVRVEMTLNPAQRSVSACSGKCATAHRLGLSSSGCGVPLERIFFPSTVTFKACPNRIARRMSTVRRTFLKSEMTVSPVSLTKRGYRRCIASLELVHPPGDSKQSANYLTIEDRVLRLSMPPETRGTRGAIDHFFRSLARDCSREAVGIILSGTGTDGTAGLKEIKDHGGLSIVQDPVAADPSTDGITAIGRLGRIPAPSR